MTDPQETPAPPPPDAIARLHAGVRAAMSLGLRWRNWSAENAPAIALYDEHDSYIGCAELNPGGVFFKGKLDRADRDRAERFKQAYTAELRKGAPA